MKLNRKSELGLNSIFKNPRRNSKADGFRCDKTERVANSGATLRVFSRSHYVYQEPSRSLSGRLGRSFCLFPAPRTSTIVPARIASLLGFVCLSFLLAAIIRLSLQSASAAVTRHISSSRAGSNTSRAAPACRLSGCMWDMETVSQMNDHCPIVSDEGDC